MMYWIQKIKWNKNWNKNWNKTKIKLISMESTNEWKSGGFNEQGMVANFGRQGMELDLASKELIANSIDAGATEINFFEEKDKLYLSDNGKGISIEENNNMFSVYRSNHEGEKKLGVSGIGGKLATHEFSKDVNTYRNVIIYSNGKDGYLKTMVPWKNITEKGQYTNMITTREMNDEEKKWFKSKLEHTGTIYEFENTENIQNLIKEYFIDSSHLHLDKRIEYIFGKFKLVDIQYNGVPLLKYDYFGGEPHEYIMYETWKIGAFEGKKK